MGRTDYIAENRLRKERIVLIIYSIYTLAMMFVSILFQWGSWIPPVIVFGMITAWMVSVKSYKDYRYRAFFIGIVGMINFSIYGMFAESFVGILSTLGALVILLGIFNIPEIVLLSAATAVYLMLYHAFFARTIQVESIKDGFRLLLQVCSIFVIECVTYYLVKTNIELNDALVDTIEDLEKAEKSKDDFMANVSHEIRTPINTVCGMSELVLREEIPNQAKEYTLDIQTAGRNLLSVVSDILDFSELESGKMELIEEPYNLTSTVNDVMNIAIAQKNGKNIELIVDCDANIPCSLLGDEQKLRRVIMNLVNNAIKFTKEGCVLVRFAARPESYGINLCVSVKDTGIGMKPETIEKLFTTFNQVDTRKNREEGGLGLGLAISQAIVEKMGGFITINSEFGKGSEVQFVIPQKVLDETPIVSVKEPDKIRVAAYINMEKYDYAAIRDGYADTIGHIARQLHIHCRQCRNLQELKRRLEKKKYSHIFISWEEYCEDTVYFDELAEQMKVILVLERENELKASVNRRMLRIYKPFYALSIAAVLNGENIVQSIDSSQYQNYRFIAPKANVLVVDDNMMNLKVVEGLLRPYKIQVFTATSGKEALSKLDTMDYDFVFMDHMMPEMDGVETLHFIRQKPGNYFKNVPVIALTANAIGGVREMFLSEGFSDFVAKPIELSVLERVLRRFIPEHKIIKVEEYDLQKQNEEQQQANTENTKELKLEGINVEKGIGFCGGSMEDYLEVVLVYYDTGLQKIGEIEEAYRTGDWKNYTIFVHAVKSTSLGIGAEKLSEMAKALEAAGKEENIPYIQANHAEMMQEYRRVMEVLKARVIPKEEIKETAGELPEIEKKKLKEALTQLATQLETFESTGVEQILTELFTYRYQEAPLEEMLAEIATKVKEFDFMGAGDALAMIQEKVG